MLREDELIIEHFYLWETNETLLDIYKTVRNYLDETYSLTKCSNVLIELAKEYSAKVSYVLDNIIFIHYGYLNIIIEDNKNSSSET